MEYVRVVVKKALLVIVAACISLPAVSCSNLKSDNTGIQPTDEGVQPTITGMPIAGSHDNTGIPSAGSQDNAGIPYAGSPDNAGIPYAGSPDISNSFEPIPSDYDYSIKIDKDTQYAVSDMLFGLFLEDINFAIDGGLYAELVKNRSFEYGRLAKGDHFHGWETYGGITHEVIDGYQDGSFLNENNTHYIRITNTSGSPAGIGNVGFLSGMSVREGETYNFSGYFKSPDGYDGNITIQLKDTEGNLYGEAVINGIKNRWWKYEAEIVASKNISKNLRLYVLIDDGTIDMDMVSLFPQNTYKGRKNGLRKDLAEALEDLSPKFIRFPGGCAVEGENLQNAYSWKDSIGNGLPFTVNGKITYGDIAARPLAENIWGNEGTRSNHPYYMSYGFGFYEYFLLCEDLNAEPVPVLNAGMSCQIQGTRRVGISSQAPAIGSDEFDRYVQDALDLVEFCRGDATTDWGAVRIAMGHKEAFDLTYIGIGNEQWGDMYFSRYEAFKDAFEQAASKNPDLYGSIKLIVANGPVSTDRYAWNKIKLYGNSYAGLVDEHYYMEPSWFLANTNRYGAYGRDGVPVYLGEYAAKSNTMEAALAEAAFMTGLERNGDIVKLASYAPLFGNGTSYQWTPDLIWFMNDSFWKSANYYVQQLFSNNACSAVMKTTLERGSRTKDTSSGIEPVYEVSGISDEGDLIIKIVNVSGEAKDILIQIVNTVPINEQGILSILAAENLSDMNNYREPDKLTIKNSKINVGKTFVYSAPAYSVSAIRIPNRIWIN